MTDPNRRLSEKPLEQRIAVLETHQEYAATREDVLRAVQETNTKVENLTATVQGIKEHMAPKHWITGTAAAALFAALLTAWRIWGPQGEEATPPPQPASVVENPDARRSVTSLTSEPVRTIVRC